MKKFLFTLVLAAGAGVAQAGAAQDAAPEDSVPAVTDRFGDTVADIRRLIGTPACSSNAQCRTLPVGALACGGPRAYLAYSTGHVDARRLQALAERSRAQGNAENARSGEMSVCRHLSDPGAVCVAGNCQLSTASTAN